MQKTEKLSLMNVDFLRELATNLSLSFRDYSSYSKEDIVKLLCNKLTLREIETVTELFFLCVPPRKVAEEIKQADMFDLRDAVENFFAGKKFLHEVKIDGRRCDVVFCDKKSVVAIEIKSGNDDIKRAIEQTAFYKLWANEVYLAFDRSHRSYVQSNIANNGVGLLEYSEGKIHQIKKAPYQEIDPHNRLLFVTYRDLAKIARNVDADFKGTKKEIATRVSEKLSSDAIDGLFCDYLRQIYS